MRLHHVVCSIAVGISFMSAANAQSASADVEAGENLFKRQCGVCHSTEAGTTLMGPSMFGIVGREAGTVDGFPYSRAMHGAEIVWDAEKLDAYIRSPRKVVPGTNMAYPGERHDDRRADIVAYLETLK